MYNIAEDTGLGKGWERMIFNTGSALLDAIVLAVVSREPEGTYGYKITQEVRQAIDLSESTLYPVLRRLQKCGSAPSCKADSTIFLCQQYGKK